MMQVSATPNAHPQLKDAVSHLADLIAYDTTSAYSNLELIQHMEEFFASLGAEVTVLPDESGEKDGRSGPGGGHDARHWRGSCGHRHKGQCR